MRKNFITGLAILLPIAITFGIIIFLIKTLTNPFLGFVQGLLAPYNIFGHQVLIIISRIAILLFLFCFTFIAGFLARVLFIKYLFRVGNFLIQRIPVVNTIYAAAQDITGTLFGSDEASFSQTVLVPFPHSKCYSIGFVVGDKEAHISTSPGLDNKVSIFLPGCPNPMMGFMQIYKQSEITFLDIKPEDAVKFVVSCGVMMPELKT